MADNISPEERLLRLIRKEKKQEVNTPGGAAISTDKNKVPSTTALKPPVVAPAGITREKYPYPVFNQRIIRITFGLSCIYFVLSLIYPLVGLRRIKLPQVPKEKGPEALVQTKEQIKPFEFYLEGITKRQLFSSVSGQQDIAGAPQDAQSLDLIKDLNLVGVVSGKTPQAIIEDKRVQKTYYLSKGQFISNFMVEDIQQGKVILSYKGQRFELYL